MAVSDLARVCEHCVHWGTSFPEDTASGYRMCHQPALSFAYGLPQEPLPSAGLVIVTGEGDGRMMTGPWFGCLNWTRKQES